jgi:glycosyltransferase involved in cell wall biosynthesis
MLENSLKEWQRPIGPNIKLPAVSAMVVIPVFNEADSIVNVLKEWIPTLEATHKDNWAILVVDDASTDQTHWLVQQFQHPKVHIVKLFKNSGHWTACAFGYSLAIQSGCQWIIQIDSDGQCDPQFYPALWAEAVAHNRPVFGERIVRLDGMFRTCASYILRHLVRYLTGIDHRDANVPYRIMPSDLLAPALAKLIHGPPIRLGNVALACLLARQSVGYVPITFRQRTGGHAHVPPWKFLCRAWELYRQLPAAINQ